MYSQHVYTAPDEFSTGWKFDQTLRSSGTVQYFLSVHMELWIAGSGRLDSGEQVKSYAASAKRNTRGKKRGETGVGARKRRSLPFPALFFPSSIFRRRPNFLPAPHRPNAWNRLNFERLGVSIFVRLRWFRVNRTPKRTNFQPVVNSSSAVWT